MMTNFLFFVCQLRYMVHVYMYTQNIVSFLDLKYKIRFDNLTD